MENATKTELEQMKSAALQQISSIDESSIYSPWYWYNQSKRAELVAFLVKIEKELLYRYDNERCAASAMLQQRDPLRFARRR
jgi:hypothetical protein